MSDSPIRRVVLDVEKPLQRPELIDLAGALHDAPGVDAVTVSVEEIDLETVALIIVVEGESIEYSDLVQSLEQTGAVLRSLDEVSVGAYVARGAIPSRRDRSTGRF